VQAPGTGYAGLGENVQFLFESGRIESLSTPDDETMEKMEQIATLPGAELAGEDGATSRQTISRRDIDPLLLVLGGVFAFAFTLVFVMMFVEWLLK
jgi:hypothetical protein